MKDFSLTTSFLKLAEGEWNYIPLVKEIFRKKSKVGYKKMRVDLGMSKPQPLSKSRMGKECQE